MTIHYILFAIFPVIFIYAHNIDEVIFSDIYIPLLMILLFAIFTLFILRIVLKKDLPKAAILTSFFLVYFFSYGYLYEFGNYWTHHRYLIIGWTMVFVVCSYLVIRSKSNLKNLNDALNLVSVLLVLLSLFTIVNYKLNEERLSDSVVPLLQEMSETKLTTDMGLPDIYYIVVDAYGSSWGLEKFYNYKNTNFVEKLEEKEFYVVDNGISNYNSTSHVLAALLNMNYIKDIVPTGVVSRETVNSRQQIQQSIVPEMLKKLGYTNIHVGSFWGFSYNNQNADININKGYLSEFSSILYERTILHPFGQKFNWMDMRSEQYDRILYQFDEMEKIPEIKEPTFTFAHLGTPHSPFVFDQDGNYVVEESAWEEEEYIHAPQDYLNQLIYINKKLLTLVDTILDKSESDPIIVLQSDHGSRIHKREGIESLDDITDDYIKDRMRNFSAYYLPNSLSEPYSEMTQVNSFRIIFNGYFGTEFKLIEDKSLFISPLDKYKFIDVSDVVKY